MMQPHIAAYQGTAAEGPIASHLQFTDKINLDFSLGAENISVNEWSATTRYIKDTFRFVSATSTLSELFCSFV